MLRVPSSFSETISGLASGGVFAGRVAGCGGSPVDPVCALAEPFSVSVMSTAPASGEKVNAVELVPSTIRSRRTKSLPALSAPPSRPAAVSSSDILAALECLDDAFGFAGRQGSLGYVGSRGRRGFCAELEGLAREQGEQFAIEEGELDLAARQGDDSIALAQDIAGLQGPHLACGVAGECLSFDCNNRGNCLRGRNVCVHLPTFVQ